MQEFTNVKIAENIAQAKNALFAFQIAKFNVL